MIKPALNAIILMMMIASIFNMFIAIKYALEYMLLPKLVPLIWFLIAVPTAYYSTMLVAPLLY
jgi:hypothetical protein